MASMVEKRQAPRIQLDRAVTGSLSHVPVSVLDLSTSGARIQHDSPLTFRQGRQFVLDFTCNGERFQLTSIVARSRLELNQSARQMSYTTGIRFVDADQVTMKRLEALLANLVVAMFVRVTPASCRP